MLPENGNRRAANAAGNSVGETAAPEFTPLADSTQVTSPDSPARAGRASPRSREGRLDWLRGVCGDAGVGVLYRFALLGLALHHRRDEPGYDAIARELRIDREIILKGVDIAARRGWLLAEFPKHSGLLFTFPTSRSLRAAQGSQGAVVSHDRRVSPHEPAAARHIRHSPFGPNAIKLAHFLRGEGITPDESTISLLGEINDRFPGLSARDLFGGAMLAAALALEARGSA